MNLMTCPTDEDLLPLATDQSEDAGLSEHLASCSSCRQRLERLGREVHALRRFWGDDSSAPWSHVEPAPDPLATTQPDDRETEGQGSEGVPARIGKYLVVASLDHGGQADVYRVVHPGLGRDLALKLYIKRPWTDLPDEAADRPEGQFGAECDHPGLLRVLDAGTHDERLFLVTEFVRGRNLNQFAQDLPPDPRRAARLVAEVARAAGFCHRRGVVHQDIKPGNILVDDQGRARLIDFGLARWRHAWSTSEDGPEGGTPAFMPPEQAQGKSELIGPRSDVFALGAVLYFLLTGKAPFQGESRQETWGRAYQCDFDRGLLAAKQVPRRLEQITLQAMAADPEQRHATAEALARELEWFLGRPRRLALQAGLLLLAAIPVVASALRPAPLAPPLRINSFQVDLHRRDAREYAGPIGSALYEAHVDDDVRIRARVGVPAYCFLIALNPDGKEQLCSPDDPAKAPGPTTEINFPSDPSQGFGLTDGTGMQAFVLVASREPLPPYAEWRRTLGALPWRAEQAGLVWQYDGAGFEALQKRGTLRRLTALPPAFAASCRTLQAGKHIAGLRALAFPVLPAQPTPER